MKYLLLLLLISSCVPNSRHAKIMSPPSWDIVDYDGDDTYDPITFNQVQDYLALGFWMYTDNGVTSIHYDRNYNIYEVLSGKISHSGMKSFDQAFRIFYQYSNEEMAYMAMKRQSIYLPNPEIELPVD